jgi:membrane protein required for colicin V production
MNLDDLRAAFEALGWVDGTLLAVLAISVLVGLWRGFTFEAMSLAGWVVAYFAAQWAVPQVAGHIGIGSPGSELNHAAAFALCFAAALLVWALLARLLRLLVHATPLTLPDRALGAVFGLLRGAVLLLALATVVTLTPAAQSEPWQASTGARWLSAIMQGIGPMLPPDVAQWLPD